MLVELGLTADCLRRDLVSPLTIFEEGFGESGVAYIHLAVVYHIQRLR